MTQVVVFMYNSCLFSSVLDKCCLKTLGKFLMSYFSCLPLQQIYSLKKKFKQWTLYCLSFGSIEGVGWRAVLACWWLISGHNWTRNVQVFSPFNFDFPLILNDGWSMKDCHLKMDLLCGGFWVGGCCFVPLHFFRRGKYFQCLGKFRIQ